MTDSPEFDSFSAYVRVVSTDIQFKLKWMARWTDLHNPLNGAGYCLDPDIHPYDHTKCPEELTDTMCDKINCKAAVDWQYSYKAKQGAMFSRDNTWANAERWVSRIGTKCMSGPFIVSWH